MKKKDLNYRIIMGMWAVGNQCKDCDNRVNDKAGTLGCKVLNAQVNPKAHCDRFQEGK